MTRIFLAFAVFALMLTACGNAQNLKKEMVASPTTQADKDKNAIIQYAIDNKLDVKSTPSGIYYVMEKEGDGKGNPSMTDKVTAHYHGTLLDGTIFDSSVDRGTPFEFSLGGVVKGWQEAIPLLSRGGKGKFIIPSALAYGERGAGAKIGPNSVLIFDIELIDFADPSMAASAQNAKDDKIIQDYIATNGLTMEKTEKGVYYQITKKGKGLEHPTLASTLNCHYHGTLLDGTVFDSSVDRGKPIDFPLGRVIPGWQDAIPLLTAGGKGKFIIPSSLAYGPQGGGPIPPNSVLIFDVELISFK